MMNFEPTKKVFYIHEFKFKTYYIYIYTGSKSLRPRAQDVVCSHVMEGVMMVYN
jgi:hypothetical protein